MLKFQMALRKADSMANKVFNNEFKSNISTSSKFEGKMTNVGNFPKNTFKATEKWQNKSIDYGNTYTQKITTSMVKAAE